MRRWLVERPRARRRGRRTRRQDFGLSDDQIDERFAAYNARFRRPPNPEED